MTPAYDPRAELQEEVTRRLRPVCPDVPEAELQALVARLVEAELAHRRARASHDGPPQPATVDGD